MGLCGAKHNVHGSEGDDVERQLQQAEIDSLTDWKVLLLGAGESGKSTVVKQISIINKGKIDEDELRTYAQSLRRNAFDSMITLVSAVEKLGISFEDDELALKGQELLEFAKDDIHASEDLNPDIAADIERLWQSNAIREAYDRRNEYWLLEAAQFYLDNLPRFMESDYLPTEEDCIMARVRTSGIVETAFDYRDQALGQVHYRIVDVGGQRNERKKWIHCFDDVKAILFIVNLAGYNGVLFEDQSKNRMHEAMELFRQITNMPQFSTTPIVLFLNKKDLFEEMIRKTSIKVCFPEYTGGNTVMESLDYIRHKFQEHLPEGKVVNDHFISARFKKDVKYSFEEVHQMLVAQNRDAIERARRQIQKRMR